MNQLFSGSIDVWPVLVSGIASLVIGFLWYGPLFGGAWAGYTGWTPERVKAIPAAGMARTYGLTFLAALVTAAALSALSRAIGASGIAEGAGLGLVTGVGLTGMAFATTHLFEHKPVALWLIVSGYQLAYMTAASVIVTVWR